MSSIATQLQAYERRLPYFLVRQEASSVQIAPIENYEEFFASVSPAEVSFFPFFPYGADGAIQQLIAFVDPSADASNPGWPLRNLLAYLRALYPSTTTSIRVLRWRDSEASFPPNTPSRSLIGTLTIVVADTTRADHTAKPAAVGWEKNPQGKLGPRVADLAPMMDPTR